jgi:hypothetical protein
VVALPGSPSARGAALALALLAAALAVAVGSLPSSGTQAGGVGIQDADMLGCHCHNVAPDPNVTMNVMGVPERYSPDTSYDLTITVAGGPPIVEGMANEGGFILTVTNGTLAVPVGSDLVQVFNDERSASHTLAGNDHRQWRLVWNSPKAGTGDAVFYLSANTVNGDGVETGELDSYNQMRTVSFGTAQVVEEGGGVSEWGVPLRAYWMGTIGFVAVLVLTWAAFYVIRGTSRHHVVHIGRRMRYRVEERTPPSSFGAAVVIAALTAVEAVAAGLLTVRLVEGEANEGVAVNLGVVLALFAIVLAVYRSAFVPRLVRIEPEEAARGGGG